MRTARLSILFAFAALEIGCNCNSPGSDGATDSGTGGGGESSSSASDTVAETSGADASGSDTDAGGSTGGDTDGEAEDHCGYAPAFVQRSVPVGYAMGLAMGDIDGDGIGDLVVARASHDQPGALSVLLAEAPGEYGPPVDTVEDVAQSVGVGDFDEDGNLDVLSISFPSTAYALRHVGGGALEVMSETPSGNNCKDVEVADIDADGHLDFAIMCESQETSTETSEGVRLFRGLGDGTFEQMAFIGAQEPHGMHLVDLTGDGRLDVVTSAFAPTADPQFLVHHQTDEGFVFQQAFPMPWPADAASGDFDEDGDLDVVMAQEWGEPLRGVVNVFLNDGGVLAEPVPYDVVGDPYVVGVSDFDQDGHLDLVSGGDGLMHILLGDGTGAFVPSAEHGCGAGRRLFMAHANEDDRLDVVHTSAGGVTVRFEDDHLFGQPMLIDAVEDVEHVELADLDGDGHLDLATLGRMGLQVRRGAGDGTFSASWSIELDPSDSRGLTAGDVDGDGVLDLVTARRDGVHMYAGAGDGSFGAAEQLFTTAAVGVPRFGDLDADGVDDLLVPREYGLLIRLATGDVVSRSVGDVGSGSVAVYDVDGDGAQDVIVVGGDLGVLYGDNTGELADPVIVETEESLRQMVLADIDGDGDPDVVSVGPHAQAGTTFRGLTALENDGGVFVPAVLTDPVGMDMHSLAAADLDGDGRDDIVSFEHASMAVSLWSGPELTHGGVYPINGIPQSSPLENRDGVTIGDVDEDGVLDILAADPYQDRVVLMRGELLTGESCR